MAKANTPVVEETPVVESEIVPEGEERLNDDGAPVGRALTAEEFQAALLRQRERGAH